MTRAGAVILGGMYAVLSLLFAVTNDANTQFVVALLGLLAALATLVHPRAGMVLFVLTAAFALLASVNVGGGFLLDVAVYGVAAYLAYRSARGRIARREERRLAAERADRADRYMRQQLGE